MLTVHSSSPQIKKKGCRFEGRLHVSAFIEWDNDVRKLLIIFSRSKSVSQRKASFSRVSDAIQALKNIMNALQLTMVAEIDWVNLLRTPDRPPLKTSIVNKNNYALKSLLEPKRSLSSEHYDQRGSKTPFWRTAIKYLGSYIELGPKRSFKNTLEINKCYSCEIIVTSKEDSLQ